MKFDVYRTETVRVKIARVEAADPSDALQKTDTLDLGEFVSQDHIQAGVPQIGEQAVVEFVDLFGAAPSKAMVEISGTHGARGEHHFVAHGSEGARPSWRTQEGQEIQARQADANALGEPSDALTLVDVAAMLSAASTARDALSDCLAAIDSLAHEVHQMKGMFDDADGTTADALEAGEDAEDTAKQARLKLASLLKGFVALPAVQSTTLAEDTVDEVQRPRGG